jgi:hypothetical protein
MQRNLSLLLRKGSIIIFFFGCSDLYSPGNPYPSIESIPPPAGYRRMAAGKGAFGEWLRQIPLKKDRTVYLFDGTPKRNQDAQFAVLNISVGHTDLQQCADAVMRLRAEFLYSQKDFADINFYTQQGTRLNFREWAGGRRFRLSGDRLVQYVVHSGAASDPAAGSSCEDRDCFSAYLETVFSYCGTLSLEKQLIPVSSYDEMRIGDVLIRGGSPGHAMLVVDMAEDSIGHKVYLLAQSYMPAQDIHIVKNPSDSRLSPWYRVDREEPVIATPEWIFYQHQLRTWPKLGE